MADEQDLIQRRLENVNEIFRLVMQGSIPIELLDMGQFKNQFGKGLSQLKANVSMIEDCFGVDISGSLQGVDLFNQTIDGYRLDKIIESLKAEIGQSEIREDKK